MKTTLRLWMLTVSVAFGLAACTSLDNPVAEMVDQKDFTCDQYVDASVRPGDDFYRYALGGWLNDEEGQRPYANQVMEALKEAFARVLATSQDPVVAGLRQLAEQNVTGSAVATDLAAVKTLLARIDAVRTEEELLNIFTELQQQGYQPLLRLAYTVEAGTVKGCISMGSISPAIKNLVLNAVGKEGASSLVPMYSQYLTQLGFSEERVAEITERAMVVEEMEFAAYVDEVDLLKHPRQARHRAARRLARVDELRQLMGIDLPSDLFIDRSEPAQQEALEEIIGMLFEGSEESVATLRDYMLYQVVAHDIFFLIPSRGEEDMVKNALGYVNYYRYRLIIDEYGPENIHKQTCNDIMEDYRTMLASRIEQLDWMSSATKQEALKKLAKMKFCIGYPDEWNEAFTPTVEGATLLQAVESLRRQSMQFVRHLIGTDMMQGGWDYYATLMPAEFQNAMYHEFSNTLVIMPCFLSEPAYDPSQSDATLYGMSCVFGHEMTHGFDSKGARYDERGAERDWWTAEDKAAFEVRQQQLIELYNQLEAFPGQLANGEMTLAENMADYAGVTLSFECYKQLLRQQGFTGADYDRQLRRFWLSYACLWIADEELDEEKLIGQYLGDEHSAAHNRVNGIARLFDDWYRLFDVKPTDALWVAPEERVKIW